MTISSYVTQERASTFGPNVTDRRIKPMQSVPSTDVNQRLDQNQPDGTTRTSPSVFSILSIPFNRIIFPSEISPRTTQTQLLPTQPSTTEAAVQPPVNTTLPQGLTGFQTPSLYQQLMDSSSQAMQSFPTIHLDHPRAMYSTGFCSQAHPTPTTTQVPVNSCTPMVGMTESMADPKMVAEGVSMQQSMSPPDQMLIQTGATPTALPPHGRVSPVPQQAAVLPTATSSTGSTEATSGSTHSGSQQTATGARIKLLLSSDGKFMKNGAGQWEYVGGETRLVTVTHTITMEELLKDLSKANKSVLHERCQIKYALRPGAIDVLVDLKNDSDVDNMWDEWQTFTMMEMPNDKLHLYAEIVTDHSRSVSDQLSDRSHRSGSSDVSDADGSANGSLGASSGNGGSFQSVTPPQILVNNASVKKDPRISLLELEGKIEIIAPEDLTLVRFLGAGGYGEVYLCRWHSSNVAVKCLNPSLFTANGGLGTVTEEVVAELMKEANMLGGLRHPNVVWIYGLVLPLGEAVEQQRLRLEPGQTIDAINLAANAANATGLVPGMIRPPGLMTEFLPGGSLNDAIVRREEYLGSKTIRIKLLLDTARGMEYLHSKRIVHFDLKSANLLVGFNHRTPMCKVADFGLSKQRQQTYVTGVTSQRGTLPWTAPEILKTPAAVDHKVDVYSFGIVMWEMWTLREPYEGVNYHALLHMMLQQEGMRPALPGSAEWDLGEIDPPADGWMELMTACWAEAPSDRPCFVDIVQSLTTMLVGARSARRTGS